MGRKIPGRKHRGVRDPEKQRAERLAKIKDKINAAPSNPDDQQIPSSLSRIIELKNKVKQGLYDKKKKRKNKEEKESAKPKHFKGRPAKNIPKFEQLPGETDREFKNRVNRICNEVIREAAFEDKYSVDIKRNQDGEVESVVKRPKDELELLVKKMKKEKKLQKNKKGKKKKDSMEEQPRLTKSQKWALKKAEKKKKKESEREQDDHLIPQKENVKFGEIVHAPPTLTAPRKVEKIQGARRPGQKQLILNSMLGDNQKIQEKNKKGSSKVSKIIDKKGKRRDLPHATRRLLEKQQKEVVEAYKTMKSKKNAIL